MTNEKTSDTYEITPESELELTIISSPVFLTSASFGNQRKGHPEGDIGLHIKQILDFINKQGWNAYRTNLRLLALLHDLGKPLVIYSPNGNVVGKGHSMHSVDIAKEFTSDERLLSLIGVHDKYYHFYRDDNVGRFKRDKFLRVYRDLDLNTLIRFNYADSNNREKDSVRWLEDKCQDFGLIDVKIYETDLKK